MFCNQSYLNFVSVFTYIIFNLFFGAVFSYSFTLKDVNVISSETGKGYFGYSLLLQQGSPSNVIVGAPEQTEKMQGGSAFKCILDGRNSCEKILYDPGLMYSPIGNFFGGSIDGQDNSYGNFSVCSHLWSTFDGRDNNFPYPKGRCLLFNSDGDVLKELNPSQNKQEISGALGSGFYDYGLALAGLDQTYIQEENQVLLGVPGVRQFDGVTALCRLDREMTCREMPNEQGESPEDTSDYFGYKVATGRFDKVGQQLFYIAGAPRANHLKGKVVVFRPHSSSPHGIKKTMTFHGDEVGAYFGSVILAVDVNNDGIDDVLVGAPMSAGSTYDEGYVNYYLIQEKKYNRDGVKLTGSNQAGSRFGSSIVSLGDFDLDSFNDVAISAPYENGGVGAVYIYRGSKQGLQLSQRISPSDFTIPIGSYIESFGLGLSRGVDIDENGHNDLAVGAYKSNKIMVITSYTIIDFKLSLHPNVNAIGTDTTNFSVEYCFIYTQRSPVNNIKNINVGLTLDLDYRTHDDGLKVFNQTVELGEKFCDNYIVKIADTAGDISNFDIGLTGDVNTKNIIANGENYAESSIAIAHGCGSDNICNTKLSLEMNSNSPELILGLDKEFQLKVEVTNTGEPAYQCKIKLEVPDNVELHNTEDCERDSDNILICFVDKRLVGSKKKQYTFDVTNLDANISEIEIRGDVISLGHNDLNFTDLSFVAIPVSLKNSPYIVGKSQPDTIDLEAHKRDEKIEIVHKFTVGNLGPSPLKLDVDVLLPILGDEDNFDVTVKGSFRGTEILCTPNNSSILDIPEILNIDDNLSVPINKTIQISCLSEQCVKYSCQGGYLVTSNEVANFEAKINVDISLLEAVFKEKQKDKELYIIYLPTGAVRNVTNIISTTSRLTIIYQRREGIPLYVVIISVLAGFGLLILVVYGLYVFHFFDRVYKDKLQQEKILDSGSKEYSEDLQGTSNEAMGHDVELSEVNLNS